MRARLAALGALLLVAAPPAAAQDGARRAQPAVGGGSPNAAPLLEAGTYRDTILAGETLFYAIRVEPGEQLRLRATIEADKPTWKSSGVYWIEAEARTALREPFDIAYADGGDDEGSFASEPGGRLERLTEPAETLRESADTSTRYLGPGVWYASFYARPLDDRGKPVEVPYRLELAKEGAPIPDAPATGVPPPPRRERETGADEPGDDGGSEVVPAAASGALIGLLVGALLRRRRNGGR